MIAVVALLLLSPLLIMIAAVLSISYRGNPLFLQNRPGKDGRIFRIIKFKTMNDRIGIHGHLLSDYERLTGAGRLVRKTSLDELPQLINVLKGEMSLVGPRPLLPEYLPLYSQEQMKRHLVKPGITGLAQINGRNALTWDEKFSYDLEYVDNISLALDFRIAIITLEKVAKRKNINAEVFVTTAAFKGNVI